MSAKSSEMPFESALEQLENLVNSLEKGDVPLSHLVDKFEEGNKLIKVCQSRLQEAETRIEKLRQKDGMPVAEDESTEENF
jgi:exodeoxyribonuclease VII small subunit